jgi:AAA domain/Nuclease-related domain/UvrD-like helicase C-terminal domain
MANLLPFAFSSKSITNRDERLVVEFLVDALDESWYIYPGFRMREYQRDFESDILLVSPHHGVGIIEVKGGNIHIDRGVWINTPGGSDPVSQAVNNSYRVAEVIKDAIGYEMKVAWAIWLPRAKTFEGVLPAGLSRSQLFLGADLNPVAFSVDEAFLESAPAFKLSGQDLERVINALCPSAQFTYDPLFEERRVRERLETIMKAQIDSVASLEKHKRVFVQGGAGTGKTALAVKWAYSALHDENPKRVLLTCYNEPLAAKLREEMQYFESEVGVDRYLEVGAFLPLMLSLPGMPSMSLSPSSSDYWDEAEAHVLEHAKDIEVRFDRIIVDETQDFDPRWLDALEMLLDPIGDQEFFLMGDSNQALIDRGFEPPLREDGWVVVTLPRNVRNVREIAKLAYRAFKGAKAIESPTSEGAVQAIEVPEGKDLWPGANIVIQDLTGTGVPRSEILVIASSAALRNQLREKLGLVAFENRTTESIVCETPHRAKGLEFNYVVLVLDARLENPELYVALTRAINKIYIVGWKDGLARLSVKPTRALY